MPKKYKSGKCLGKLLRSMERKEYPDEYGAIWDKYEVMCNKQLGFTRTKASQTQVMAFWDRTAQTSQGKECGGYKGPGPQETRGPLSTALEPRQLVFPMPNWYQWPRPVAGEEWGIGEPWSCHLTSVPSIFVPGYTRGIWGRASEWSGGPSLLSLGGVRVSLCKSLSRMSEDPPQSTDIYDWPFQKK